MPEMSDLDPLDLMAELQVYHAIIGLLLAYHLSAASDPEEAARELDAAMDPTMEELAFDGLDPASTLKVRALAHQWASSLVASALRLVPGIRAKGR